MMNRYIKLISIVSLFTLLLVGCSQASTSEPTSAEPTIAENNKESIEKSVVVTKELIIRVQDIVKVSPKSNNDFFSRIHDYVFNGFMGEDTLVFEGESSNDDEDTTVFVPAKVGHKFTFKEVPYTFEILEFNRDEAYLKVKVTNS